MGVISIPRNTDTIRNRFGHAQVTSIIEATLIRPSMDTIGASVFEVGAFLEGYFSGLAKHAPEVDRTGEWQDFLEHLGEADSSN